MNIKRFLELLFKFNFKEFLWLKWIKWEIPQNLQRPHIQNDLGLHFGKSRRCTFRFCQRKHNAVAKVIQGEGKTFSFYLLIFFISHPSLIWFLSRVWQRTPNSGQFFSVVHDDTKCSLDPFRGPNPPLFSTFCHTPPRAGFRWCHHQSMEGN